MDIKEILYESLKENFKHVSIIRTCLKTFEQNAEKIILKKYKGQKIYKDGLEFELLGVDAHCYYYGFETCLSITDINISVSLTFTCCSKLNKEKQDRLEKAKQLYKAEKRIGWNNYKIPIWHVFQYEISLDKIINKNINLAL